LREHAQFARPPSAKPMIFWSGTPLLPTVRNWPSMT
jgi:hypothetical protein